MADDALKEAIANARANPSDEDAWDAVEEVAADTQSPEGVAELYREVISGDIGPELATSLGRRAVSFLEEWFGEDSTFLVDILSQVLGHDPSADWAFSRLTVVHTAAGRFDDLLALYDRALEATEDDHRRADMLDEAANVAKDFAGDSLRAIQYMRRLLPLRPKDKSLASSLERLLEKESQWQDLIDLWTGRIGTLKKKADVHAMRERIATCYLDRLERPADALAEVKRLLDEGGGGDGALSLLERISSDDAAPGDVRRDALELLKARYRAADRATDVVRILGSALELADRQDAVGLHREAAEQLAAQGKLEESFGHWTEVLRLDPAARDARDALRGSAERLGAHERFAAALVSAADACQDGFTRIGLRVEAADVRRAAVGDVEGAIALYQQVLSEDDVERSVVLKVARGVDGLLAEAGRPAERIAVLERLASNEPETADRRTAVGQLARVHDELGDVEAALAAWARRAAEDERDLEALDETILILEREERWPDLVATLRKRAEVAASPLRRRADLVRIAHVQNESLGSVDDAITTWSSVADEFGESPETVDALADLLSKAERWNDVSELLGRAADREADHVASIYARIGDVQREQLDELAFATESYASALRIDPGYEPARDGLAALLEVPDCRGPAAESLAMAYGSTDEWSLKIEVLEHRLASVPDDGSRVRLLREAAQLQEHRAEDLRAALGSMRRAMALAPEMRDIEADVFRLAEATSDWSAAIDAIRAAVSALGEDAPRARYLRNWEGKLVETHLGDPEAALAAYSKVFDGEPSRAENAVSVVRTAGAAALWSELADALVRSTAAAREVVPSVVEMVETVAVERGAWDEVTNAVERALASSEDLTPGLGRELETILAHWHAERRSDPDAAQAALARAVAREDTHVPTLVELSALQRRAPGRALYATLVRLADLLDDDLDPLHEATRVAFEALGDDELGRTTAERLYREASRLWRRNATLRGQQAPEACTRWAIARLVAVHEQANDPKRAVALLSDAALLPVPAETSLEWRRSAARIAAASGDAARAIVLYRGILDETPDDTEVLGALADLCMSADRLPERMSLLSHELSLTEDPERRLTIRLELANLVGELERRGGRVESLLANLEESPGHEPTIDAIVEVLELAGRHAQLADVLAGQARALEAAGEPKRAARLWSKVASIFEHEVNDTDRAVDAHRRVVELAATIESLEALARLHEARGEHAAAAQWLDRRLAVAEDDERPDIAVRLANAHLGAGQPERAITVLERALEQVPERADVREMLATQYRVAHADERLAALLTAAAPHIDDDATLLAYAREAADIFERRGEPGRGIPILERAAQVAPKDRRDPDAARGGLARGRPPRRSAGHLRGGRRVVRPATQRGPRCGASRARPCHPRPGRHGRGARAARARVPDGRVEPDHPPVARRVGARGRRPGSRRASVSRASPHRPASEARGDQGGRERGAVRAREDRPWSRRRGASRGALRVGAGDRGDERRRSARARPGARVAWGRGARPSGAREPPRRRGRRRVALGRRARDWAPSRPEPRARRGWARALPAGARARSAPRGPSPRHARPRAPHRQVRFVCRRAREAREGERR